MATIVDDLVRDEGFKPMAYRDHLGKLTLGIGFLIDPDEPGAQPMPRNVANLWMMEILKSVKAELDTVLPWWRALSDARQRALLNMAYQLGVAGLLKFKKTLEHMEATDFDAAASEALRSKWARQTPARAQRIYLLIKNG